MFGMKWNGKGAAKPWIFTEKRCIDQAVDSF